VIVHAKLILTYSKDYALFIRPTCHCYVIWLYLIPEPSTPFSVSCEHGTILTMTDLWCHMSSSLSMSRNKEKEETPK